MNFIEITAVNIGVFTVVQNVSEYFKFSGGPIKEDKKNSKISKNSKLFQDIPNIPKNSKKFQKIPKNSKILHNRQEDSIFQ